MKLLSFSIILSSLIISFQYAWTNRLEIKVSNEQYSLIFNKWTGNYCAFSAIKVFNKDKNVQRDVTVCKFDANGRIVYP